MDFVTNLPKSKGKDVIYAFVVRLTKYEHFIALNHPYSAVTVDQIYKLHGLPKIIVSERDPVHVSSFWRELF